MRCARRIRSRAAAPCPRWRALRRSQEIVELSREEEGLVEEGELRAAALLKAQFWTAPDSSLEVRERIVAMQERAFEPQVESEAEESEAEAIDLGAVRARTLVVVGEHDKADFHPIAERLAREIPDAQRAVIAGACHLPALERPAETARPVRDFLGI